MRALEGKKIVTMAGNIPGPTACKRLVQFGAEVVKVEPPSGDHLKSYVEAWYEDLNKGQRIISLNLKDEKDRLQLYEELKGADLFLTTQKRSSLERMKLFGPEFLKQFPQLSHLEVTAYPPPQASHPGHDLNFQGAAGIIKPPHMPLSLAADISGAERMACTAMAMILGPEPKEQHINLALNDVAQELADSFNYGLTSEGGMLSGQLDGYGLYKSSDGWVALGALEPQFQTQIQEELKLSSFDRATLEEAFLTKTSSEWHEWGQLKQLPLSAVKI